MKKSKKSLKMKRLVPIAVIFMMAFVAFIILGFIDSAKAECAPGCDDQGRCWTCGVPPEQEYLVDDDDDTGNSPPVADDDSATVDEDSSNNQINVLSNDNDPDGDSLSIDSVGDPPHGISIDDGSFVYYTPDSGYTGSDSFMYLISDGNGGIDSATITVTVNSVNHNPNANPDSAAVDEDSSNNQINVLANDNDPDGDSLSISNVGSASHGSTSLDGSFVYYTPDPGYAGSDSFSYSINDGNGGTATATVDITINLEADIPEKPTIEGGIQTCYTRIPYTFESILNGFGPNAKYYFDWNDGEEIPDPALWTPVAITPLTGDYTWSKAGVYDVKVGVYDPDSSNPETVWSLPLPVQVLHKSENPEDG